MKDSTSKMWILLFETKNLSYTKWMIIKHLKSAKCHQRYYKNKARWESKTNKKQNNLKFSAKKIDIKRRWMKSENIINSWQRNKIDEEKRKMKKKSKLWWKQKEKLFIYIKTFHHLIDFLILQSFCSQWKIQTSSFVKKFFH
jgi:hypothetical protein